MCEGQDLNKMQCLEIGCCHWNDWQYSEGKCFSDVGDGKCVKQGENIGCIYTEDELIV